MYISLVCRIYFSSDRVNVKNPRDDGRDYAIPRRLSYTHADRSRGIPLMLPLPLGAHVPRTYYEPNTNSTWKRELLEGARWRARRGAGIHRSRG